MRQCVYIGQRFAWLLEPKDASKIQFRLRHLFLLFEQLIDYPNPKSEPKTNSHCLLPVSLGKKIFRAIKMPFKSSKLNLCVAFLQNKMSIDFGETLDRFHRFVQLEKALFLHSRCIYMYQGVTWVLVNCFVCLSDTGLKKYGPKGYLPYFFQGVNFKLQAIFIAKSHLQSSNGHQGTSKHMLLIRIAL